MDYRYFPDPDLPPLVVTDEMLARIKSTMPELPEAKCARFVSQYALSEYDARLLSQDSATANFYEAATKEGADAKLVANWMLGELSAALHREEKNIEQSPFPPSQIAALIQSISNGALNSKTAKVLFDRMWSDKLQIVGVPGIEAAIDKYGLRQISDSGAIEKIVDEVLAKSAAQIADFKSGKEKALMSIVGMVMKASAGKANPAQVNDIVRRKIAAL